MNHARIRQLRRSFAGAAAVGAASWLIAAAASFAQQPYSRGSSLTPAPMMLTGNGMNFALRHVPRPDGLLAEELVGPVVANALGYASQSGVQLNVTMPWQPTYGYVPIVLTASSQQPATPDKTFTVRLTAEHRVDSRTVVVEETFAWPAGANSATGKLLIPMYTDMRELSWTIAIDGRLDPALTADYVQPPKVGSAGEVMALTTIANLQQRPLLSAALPGSLGIATVGLSAVDADDLPTEWLQYTSIDLVILPAAEWAAIVQNQPRQATALLRWVRAGGNLWLEDVGQSWELLPDVERSLGMEPADAPTDSDNDDDNADENALPRHDRGWRWPSVAEQAPSLADGVLELASLDEPPASHEASIARAMRKLAGGDVSPSKQVALKRVGMGLAAAFRTSVTEVNSGNAPTTPAALALMFELKQSLVMPRLLWASRHGNNPDDLNPEFNNLLIPGVGLAPVGQFQVLITLFVIVIGPLNYWLLKRINKLPLLLVTVPAAAAATTALLFGYGILADGFDVRVRTRSVTLLDQRAKEATAWGRLSYYAGMAPSQGLILPRDVALYPITPGWDRRRYRGRGGSPREVRWLADQQQLPRGWLASRTPTQYLQVAARGTAHRLDLRPTDAGLAVANRLGVDVTHLAVQDHQGRLYWGENISAGQRNVLAVADRAAVSGRIRRLFTENLPEFPGGAQSFYRGSQMSIYAYEIGLSHNLMEAELAAINSPLATTWGDGSYIAFTARGVAIDSGIADAVEEASFHVIRGSW